MNIPNIEEINDKEVLINLRDYLLSEKDKQTPKVEIHIVLPYNSEKLKDKFDFIKPYAIDKKVTVKQILERNEDDSWETLYAVANQTGVERVIEIPVQKECNYQRVITPTLVHSQESIVA